MVSLSNGPLLYLFVALCTAAAYFVLSTLFRCLLEFLSRQLRNNPLPNYDQNIPAVNITLQVNSTMPSQLEEHTVITCIDQNMPENESCSVCLCDYLAGDELRVLLNCKHKFHKECIDRWIVTRSSFCPICRGRVIERNEESVILGDGDISFDDLEYNPQRLVLVRVEINAIHPSLLSSRNGLGL